IFPFGWILTGSSSHDTLQNDGDSLVNTGNTLTSWRMSRQTKTRFISDCRRVVTALGYDVVWVQRESAALLEISMGRCGILLLAICFLRLSCMLSRTTTV